ncbi:MAG: 50S ribosomal protein L5 [Methanobacteriota archaeon]
MNVMRELRISKVTVNMGVGEGGEKLAKAENLLEKLTEQKPVKTLAKSTNPTFGIRKGVPIACKVTLRKEKAEKFLKKAIDAVERKLKSTNFDNQGNVSFGIKEHIDIPGVRYDPAVGIFGMDVCLTVERPGYRIKRRKVSQRKISKSHRITREEAINFMKEKYNVSVGE